MCLYAWERLGSEYSDRGAAIGKRARRPRSREERLRGFLVRRFHFGTVLVDGLDGNVRAFGSR